MSSTSRRIVGLLADEGRRRVIAALVLADEPLALAEICERADLDLRVVVDSIDRLDEMVRSVDGRYAVDGDGFGAAARAEADVAEPSALADQPDDVARVLDIAFRDGSLVRLPSKRSKRLIVLDHLAQQFEIGERYPEGAVNDLLRRFDDDVATLRRWLVDEQFLDRASGMYWRCGGTV